VQALSHYLLPGQPLVQHVLIDEWCLLVDAYVGRFFFWGGGGQRPLVPLFLLGPPFFRLFFLGPPPC
jgi:hypothetical protein